MLGAAGPGRMAFPMDGGYCEALGLIGGAPEGNMPPTIETVLQEEKQ
jgi:hypothetical protein